MRRSSLAAAAFATACLFVAAPGASGLPGQKLYSDPIGDAGTASDIASISISNSLDGTYMVNTAFATPITVVSNYIVYLDLDRNPKTGSPGGAEYAVGHCRGELVVDRWNGHRWVESSGTSAEAISPDRKFVSFTIRKIDIGGDEDFDLYSISRRMDASDDEDDAPSGATNIHYVYADRVTISDGGTVEMPAIAGGTWAVGLRALRSDNAESLQRGGAISCDATAAGNQLVIRKRGFMPVVQNGAQFTFAACEFAVPKRLNHRKLHATITVRYRGSTVSRRFIATATVRAPGLTA
jgi:hypothetical protein